MMLIEVGNGDDAKATIQCSRSSFFTGRIRFTDSMAGGSFLSVLGSYRTFNPDGPVLVSIEPFNMLFVRLF
jgi:hypothetical protein